MKSEKLQKIRFFPLAVAVLIPLFTGMFSSFLTGEDMKIYQNMNHPPLAPPGWVFPVAWTILYVLMGIASYLVWSSETEIERKRTALRFYAAQLIMNFFWSTLFFTYARILLALVWLLAMWVLVLICAIRFYRIRHAAGWMMGVLLLWTTFAAYLNFACYAMSITPMPIARY